MSTKETKQTKQTSNIAWVSVGVADMAAVHALWVDQLGLDILAQRTGPDAELAALWKLPADQIVAQLLLATPGAESGHLHFVQFREPAPAVRAAAAPTDLGAKNLDANCTDMPLLVKQLKSAGYKFRSAIGEYEIDGIRAREVQMPVHDSLNVVLIEVLGDGFEVACSDKGYAALTSFVVIVPDVASERQFYQTLFGMQAILAHKLSGQAIEVAAGLPKGTVLDLHLLGDTGSLFGRMELIEYVGVDGADCFANANPPATGILRCGFRVADADAFAARARTAGYQPGRRLPVNALFGAGEIIELRSPAGLHIQVLAA